MQAMVDRFLSWPLPDSVSSDTCVTVRNYGMERCGTSLLTAVEAQQMLEHVTAPLQAEIDRLMLEFCPDEMTEEQKANWAKHQRAATPEETAAIEAVLRR